MKKDSAVLWHTTPVSDAVKTLATDAEEGLSTEEAEIRLLRYGRNELRKKRTLGFFGTILKQFRSPLVVILLFAGLTTLFLGVYLDTLVIFIALFINVFIGAFQERRANQAFDKLNESQEKFATVVRDGKRAIISAEELVRGDIVLLEGGMYVSADMRLIEGNNLSVNEAMLTGEWIAVMKDAEQTLKEDTPLVERNNMAWMGTLIASGYGKGVVIETGEETEMGHIASALQSVEERPTPLQQNVRHIARFLVYIILAATAVIFLLGIFQGETFTNMLLVSIAIAVASMPEGLPAAVTIVLAIGMESILKKGGLVRNLLAAETLGSTTIILTDKTGTLTEAKMKLSGLYTLDGLEARHSEAEGDNHMLLSSAILITNAFIEQKDESEHEGGDRHIVIHGDPMETALVSYGIDAGVMREGLLAESPRLDFLKFESHRRFAASLHSHKGSTSNALYCIGAPELLLERASRVYYKGKETILTPESRARFLRRQSALSGEGYRVIALAVKEVGFDRIPADIGEKEKKEKKEDERLKNITFIGLIAFSDPVRVDVKESIRTMQEASIRVVMLTGDNPQTARHVALQSGIAKPDHEVLIGKDIERYSDAELYRALLRVPVFARVLPEQKLRIAHVLKDHKEVVAMTGDGVNDAPALQSADIGVAVGSGTEVAKAASDIVLLDNSFSIIGSAIEEGRRIIDNLKKIVSYLLSTSFSEIFVIGGALAFGAPLPLLPGQILWANIVEEGFMSFAFAFEKAEDGVMKRNPKDNLSKHILTKRIKKLIAITSVITGVFLIVLYFALRSLELPIEEIRTLMFVALSLDSIFFAFSFKNLHRPIWDIPLKSNKYLFRALSISVVLLIGAVTLPPLQELLSLVSLSFVEWLFLAGVGLFNLFMIETLKYFIFERVRAR
ncbi:HAD-IC family P-type ATPase [Candidatus Kaiserbacteria bacterium]|nr:HAD-IC family P-type ATPase [Candidatus Kaiserbacteria bacterium]